MLKTLSPLNTENKQKTQMNQTPYFINVCLIHRKGVDDEIFIHLIAVCQQTIAMIMAIFVNIGD